MKEAIREHAFNKSFSITLKSTGEKWKGNTLETIQTAANILEEYDQQHIVMTLRQLYYQMVGRGYIPNDDVMYKKLSALFYTLDCGSVKP